MKVGKVTESVLKRSILKQINNISEEMLIGADIGVDCAVLALSDNEAFVISTDPITRTIIDMGKLAVHTAANNIAAAGANPIGIMVSILIPTRYSESKLRGIMEQVIETCNSLHMQVMGGHTEVTMAVNQPIVTVTGVGKIKKDSTLSTSNIKPGQDIVLTKWIGLEGTSIIAKEKEEALLTKYPISLIEEAKNFDMFLSVVPEAATAIRSGVCAMHDVAGGGIFGALWEMAVSADVGLQIDLKKIPVKQETIEVCEFFDLNPYSLISGGSMLMVTDKGYDLVYALQEENINAVVIGKIMEGNDRVVINNEERRFLVPPKSDELYKIYE